MKHLGKNDSGMNYQWDELWGTSAEITQEKHEVQKLILRNEFLNSEIKQDSGLNYQGDYIIL